MNTNVNLRQTGLKPRGHVVRGAATFVSTPATIPSKFETTLMRDVQESKGFGSTSFRFEAAPVTEIPGPGAYYKPKAFEKQSDSFSKRGYGSFASKACSQ